MNTRLDMVGTKTTFWALTGVNPLIKFSNFGNTLFQPFPMQCKFQLHSNAHQVDAWVNYFIYLMGWCHVSKSGLERINNLILFVFGSMHLLYNYNCMKLIWKSWYYHPPKVIYIHVWYIIWIVSSSLTNFHSD